ncbi:glycosyltransferase family 2 protein [Methylomicrobium sp. Wu6]|uniref:glycosyltransferase family 2 protein n=1 Tax=Methylomicrobium sp. Wu6 TaxID=3107928 RepID=UPI002DD67C50|nr:glycosyltransferase family 2 protein [Methylomicrobium sp. Wu6]MEC4750315.1 glycosyltransferase family 2 protein [Methylomicrobium sp. Wu6]
MKCSLILATLGRDRELVDLLDSLAYQTYKDFELIVIDQNIDGKIDAIVETFKDRMTLKHIKVNFNGNARARDYGIQFAVGDIIAFPDDDCVYETDVLERVVGEFEQQQQLGILVAGSYDFSKTNFSIGVNSHKPVYFSRLNMMGVEFTHFFCVARMRREEFYLDHDFGINSKYCGAEGPELLYRLLRAKHKAFYTPEIKIYHANKDAYTIGSERMLKYSSGNGALIRKFFNERDVFILYYMIKKMLVAPILKMIGAILIFNSKKTEYYYKNLVGIWHGFLVYRK